jgi:hypothetical protein
LRYCAGRASTQPKPGTQTCALPPVTLRLLSAQIKASDYSGKSLAGHERGILLHRAAKKTFHGLGLKGCFPSKLAGGSGQDSRHERARGRERKGTGAALTASVLRHPKDVLPAPVRSCSGGLGLAGYLHSQYCRKTQPYHCHNIGLLLFLYRKNAVFQDLTYYQHNFPCYLTTTTQLCDMISTSFTQLKRQERQKK